LTSAGEHGAGTELHEALDAGRAHRQERLAPAHRAQQVLGELARTSVNGAAVPLA
jgi:hypothetical protein